MKRRRPVKTIRTLALIAAVGAASFETRAFWERRVPLNYAAAFFLPVPPEDQPRLFFLAGPPRLLDDAPETAAVRSFSSRLGGWSRFADRRTGHFFQKAGSPPEKILRWRPGDFWFNNLPIVPFDEESVLQATFNQGGGRDSAIVRLRADGRQTVLAEFPRKLVVGLSVSPDRSQLLVYLTDTAAAGRFELWLCPAAFGSCRELVRNRPTGDARLPNLGWRPKSEEILFVRASRIPAERGVYLFSLKDGSSRKASPSTSLAMPPDADWFLGTRPAENEDAGQGFTATLEFLDGRPERNLGPADENCPPAPSPDGKWAAVANARSIRIVELSSLKTVYEAVHGLYRPDSAQWSPDGRTVLLKGEARDGGFDREEVLLFDRDKNRGTRLQDWLKKTL